MATITRIERKSGARYKAIIKHRGRVLKTKTFQTKTKAVLWARRIESDQETVEALNMRGAAITFNSLAEEYLVHWKGRDRSWPGKVRWWMARIGGHKLINVDADLISMHLDEYAGEEGIRYDGMDSSVKPKWKSLKRIHKPASVNRLRSALSSVMKHAIQWRYIRKNPVMGVLTRPENNRITRWLSDDERKRLLSAAQIASWGKLYLLIFLAITTGARKGELLSLRWENFDFKNRTYLLQQTKNGEPRILTFPPNAIQELMKFRQASELVLRYANKKLKQREKHQKPLYDDEDFDIQKRVQLLNKNGPSYELLTTINKTA